MSAKATQADGRSNRSATTVDDLELSDIYDRDVRTKHIFRATADRALCGHPSTERHDRVPMTEQTEYATATVACENCQRALLGDGVNYQSDAEVWQQLGDLSVDDQVRVTFADGREELGVVTKVSLYTSGLRIVSITTEPETISYLRERGHNLRFSMSEGETPEVSNLHGDDLGVAERIEVVGEYDWLTNENADRRRRLREAWERRGASFRWAYEDLRDSNVSAERATLVALNRSAVLTSAAMRVRKGEPVAWVRQKAIDKIEDYEAREEDDPDTAAKVAGKLAGWRDVLAELDRI